MTVGLPVNRIINVDVFLNPQAASVPNINSLLIVGDSDIINVSERIRSFSSLTEVAAAFGTSAEEYLAARDFFGQSPTPDQLYIGKWARTAVAGRLIGGALSAAQQVLANFTAITTGSLKIAIDGAAAVTVTALNFSAATTLNGVAAILNSALTGATATWNGTQFIIKSSTTGATSSIGFPQTPGSGTNIATVFGLTSVLGATSVDGIVAETALECVTIMAGLSTYWYGLNFAYSAMANSDSVAVAGFIESATPVHIFGVTSQEAAAIDSGATSDIGYLLEAAGYTRSFVQYSTTSPYAAASMFGRILTTDFNANNSTITLMFKQEPGVTPETLTSAQANALDAKRYNYFVNFDNDTAIIVNGWCSGDAYIDEIVGLDWLAGRITTDAYNLLYTSPTKIPQTDAGNQQIANTIAASCAAAVNNGLLGPGTWGQSGFGQLKLGDYMPTGFYVYTPPIANQSSADREARRSVTFQVAAKLQGAVQSVDITVNVNR